MQPYPAQFGAEPEETWTVELQRFDGCTPDGRQAHDTDISIAPAEVLAPDLMARVEEANQFTRHGIQGRNAIGFVVVAQGTGEPKIVLLG